MQRPPRPIWFNAKRYGWGWTPVTWQGWGITLLFFCGYLLLGVLFLGWLGETARVHLISYRGVSLSVLEFMASAALLSYVLIRVCTRYGEKPRWRWGEKK